MGAKLGRNDPCHCGSGKKYKQCHQRTDESREREERDLKTIGQWVRFQVAGLESRLPADVTAAAGDDLPLRQVALFDQPAPGPQAHIATAIAEDTEAEVKTLATAFSESHVSMYECVECKRGRGVRLKDRLTGEERFVWDPDLGSQVEPLEVVLGRVVMVGDRAVIAPGYEKVWFRGRKKALADMLATVTEAAGEDPVARRAWLKANGAAVVERARAARPAQ